MLTASQKHAVFPHKKNFPGLLIASMPYNPLTGESIPQHKNHEVRHDHQSCPQNSPRHRFRPTPGTLLSPRT